MRLPQQPTNLLHLREWQASPSVRQEGQSSKCQSFQRQLGMPQHENENASEVLKSAARQIQTWEVAPRSKVSLPSSSSSKKILLRQPTVSSPSKKIVFRQPTVSPSDKSTAQLPLPIQPGPSERNIKLPKSLGPPMPSPALRSDQNFQNRQDQLSRPPGFPLPNAKMTAENARFSASQISGVQVQKQPVSSVLVANESSAFGNTNTWTDASKLVQPPPKIEMQPRMTAEQKANASNGTAQVSGVHVQKQPDTSAMVANESSHFGKTWTEASMQFQPTPEEKLQQLIGNGISPMLPPLPVIGNGISPLLPFIENVFMAEPIRNSRMRSLYWDPKLGIENVFTAEPIGKGLNGEKVIQKFTKQQMDALQALQRLKVSIGTLPQDSVHRATMSLREMEKHLMRLIQNANASPDGTHVKKYDPSTDLDENATEEQTIKRAVNSVVNAVGKAEAMEEEEQRLKKEEVSNESAATSIVGGQSETEAMEEQKQTLKKEEVGNECAATSVVNAQSEAEAMEEATPVVSIHEEDELQQQSIESSYKGNPEADDDEMQEWVLV